METDDDLERALQEVQSRSRRRDFRADMFRALYFGAQQYSQVQINHVIGRQVKPIDNRRAAAYLFLEELDPRTELNMRTFQSIYEEINLILSGVSLEDQKNLTPETETAFVNAEHQVIVQTNVTYWPQC